MNPKLLVLDLDGTSVNDRGQLSRQDRESLQEIRNRGIYVCFATGRRDIDMFSSWELCRFADFLLLNNGGKLYRTQDRSLLFNHCILPSAAKELILYCLRENLQLHIFSGEYWGVNRWTKGLQEYAEALGTSPVLYSNLEDTPWANIEGLMATEDWKPICAYIDEHSSPLSYVCSEEACMDITAPDIGKWKGISELAELLQINSENIIAAGDFCNDIEMIQKAGIGIAVANALPEVQCVADYITKQDNNHSAVSEIIRKFIPDRNKRGLL